MTNKFYRNLAYGALLYTVAVILWGAFVRATGSGAGCGSHWPLCNGTVVPRGPELATIIELTHRLTSGLILMLCVAQVWLAHKWYERGHVVRKTAWASLVFVLIEAAVGAGIVLLELVADNASELRAFWVGGHLVNTLLLVGVMTLHAWFAGGGLAPRERPAVSWIGLFGGGLALILAVAASGAMVALGDTLFPATSLAAGLREKFSPTAHFLVKLRLWHPIIAVVAAGYLVVLGNAVRQRSRDETTRFFARGLVIIVMAQVAMGFVNLALLAPVWMQIVHLLVANVLWIWLVLLGLVRMSEDARVVAQMESVRARGEFGRLRVVKG